MRVSEMKLNVHQIVSDIKRNAVSFNVYYRAIKLPSYYDLTKEEVEDISTILKSFKTPEK